MLSRLRADWRDQSIAPVAGLIDRPGLYLLHALAFGFKGTLGTLGGRHSWLALRSTDGSSIVAEVTDLETVEIQDGTVLKLGAPVKDEFQRAPMLIERDPTQMWFGSIPVVDGYSAGDSATFYMILSECVEKYPLRNKPFRIIHRNCNTFTSWALHYAAETYGIEMKPKQYLIGSRKWKR